MKTNWMVALLLALNTLPALAAGAGEHRHDAASGNAMASGHGHDAATDKPAKPPKVSRTIAVTMHDTMRFDPPTITVKAGETIRFRLQNAGGVPHEMVIGAASDLQAHARTMRMGDAAHHAPHDESAGLLLPPGQRGDLVYTFKQAGTVDFACLVPGHFEAGMAGKIDVK